MLITTTRAGARRRRRFSTFMSVLVAGSLVAAACGSDDGADDTPTPAPDTTAAGDDADGDDDTDADGDAGDDGEDTGGDDAAGPSDDARYGGSLVFGQAILTDNLDFKMATALQHELILDGIYESLLEVNLDLEFVPHLAESYEQVSETEYLFTIREGVIFHDGTPMTVDDVLFTFERILDPEYTGPSAQRLAPLETVEVVDDRTVRFVLSEPFGPFLYHMASPETTGIHSRAFAEANDDDLSMVANGTGAFKLRSFVPNERIELERHDQYWMEGLPYLDEVIIPMIPDRSTRLAGLRTGELDISEVSPVGLTELRGIDNLEVAEIRTAQSQIIFWNCEREPLNNVQVRQALHLSIDEQLIMDILFE